MSRGPDAGTALLRALTRSATGAGVALTVREADWRRWASGTFVGARHTLDLDAPAGPALDAWLGMLAEADLDTRGHLVADLAVTAVRQEVGMATIALEALTVDV